jgi:hypothetical protein
MNTSVKFKIIAKYNENPKWAIYLYYKNGAEGWNHTISGSFRAKNPVNDLTYVFDTKEEAISYANDFFENAEHLEE